MKTKSTRKTLATVSKNTKESMFVVVPTLTAMWGDSVPCKWIINISWLHLHFGFGVAEVLVKPADNAKVEFTDRWDKTFTGSYIKEEDMFYIGDEDSGEFRYFKEIKSWKYLPDSIKNN